MLAKFESISQRSHNRAEVEDAEFRATHKEVEEPSRRASFGDRSDSKLPVTRYERTAVRRVFETSSTAL